MHNYIARYESEFGYTPTTYELYELYRQGELTLTDAEESTLLKQLEAEY